MGKLIAQNVGEVKLSAAILDYDAEHAESFLAPEKLSTARGEAVVESSPVGVVFGVQPWNFHYYQVARFAAPNLMAGNTVLLKHASNVPQCALAFERLLREAGAPEGAFANLFISKDQVSKVIDDPRVSGVALTGSEGASAVVAARAGKNLKKSTLELGGSDALIVLEDADLDKAVKQAVAGRMGNAGQACTASKRIIVVEAMADRFLERFQAALQASQPGDPMAPQTTLAPLSSKGALKTLVAQVDEAVAHGPSWAARRRVARPAASCNRTSWPMCARTTPCTTKSSSARSRCSSGCPDKAAAIALANDSPFGLGGSVFTQDIERQTGGAPDRHRHGVHQFRRRVDA